MEGVLGVGGFVLFVVVFVPFMFRLKRKYMDKAIAKYNEQNGTDIEIEKSGMPPLKYWLKNRKGDCWALVVFPDGTRKWARLRGGLFSGSQPLTFLDV
ncbi:hypothetical protein Mal15_30440 [Stieleria maiorica]|uniref:Uncharacterized protein n=1 Tax=Stieleria maiorica TaxID=2795974 RepID=A0A5B9MHD9_9BACT|nr:hypothetical protein [Stieleria maiorica]QEF98985.1 hypothetical protein Mal15_30440 [Stieleria maiorica]